MKKYALDLRTHLCLLINIKENSLARSAGNEIRKGKRRELSESAFYCLAADVSKNKPCALTKIIFPYFMAVLRASQQGM